MVYIGEADTASKPKWKVTTRTVDTYACYVWWHPRLEIFYAKELLHQRYFTPQDYHIRRFRRLLHQAALDEKTFAPESFLAKELLQNGPKSFPPKGFRKTYCRVRPWRDGSNLAISGVGSRCFGWCSLHTIYLAAVSVSGQLFRFKKKLSYTL